MPTRRSYSGKFKVMVALEAWRTDRTVREIAAIAVRATQVTTSKYETINHCLQRKEGA